MTDPSSQPFVRAIVISVSDLDQSSAFYEAVVGVKEILREDQLVVLEGNLQGPFTMFLRQEPNAIRHGQQTLGIRSLTFDIGEAENLDQIEHQMQSFDAFRDRTFIDSDEHFEVVRGHDPDRLPLSFIAHQAGTTMGVDEYRQTLTRMYTVDL